MIIAIDYDGTYTKDPDLWLAFIEKAQARGHKVILVTMRENAEAGPGWSPIDERLLFIVDEDYYTDLEAKKPYLDRLGIKPDIWIDDSPEWVIFNAKG